MKEGRGFGIVRGLPVFWALPLSTVGAAQNFPFWKNAYAKHQGQEALKGRPKSPQALNNDSTAVLCYRRPRLLFQARRLTSMLAGALQAMYEDARNRQFLIPVSGLEITVSY